MISDRRLRQLRLTRKQLYALRAQVSRSREQAPFWAGLAEDGTPWSWQGRRHTLGSLYSRGLVSYGHDTGWYITGSGSALLAKVEGLEGIDAVA